MISPSIFGIRTVDCSLITQDSVANASNSGGFKGDYKLNALSMTARQEAAMSWRSNALSAAAIVGMITTIIYPASWSESLSDTPGSVAAANANPDKALQDLRHKASSGHLHDELELAGDYYAGRGVARDLSQAAYWYKKAADQGDPGAQVQIGYFYLAGIGVKQDNGQALRWFQRASSSGSHMGKLNLAVLYMRGIGVPRDYHLALNLLNDLATANDPHSEAYLGIVYMLGAGAEKNMAQAEYWFDRSAKHHSAEGNYALGTLYSVTSDHPHDFERAETYLRESSDAGYIRAKHSLGLLLVNHPELPQQDGEAVKLLQAAAVGGSWRSSVVLGILSRDGKILPRDRAIAYRWYKIAESQGGAEATTMLHDEVASIRATISADQQKQSELAAAEWMKTYPRANLFVFSGGDGSILFPAEEVYSTQLAQAETSSGADVR